MAGAITEDKQIYLSAELTSRLAAIDKIGRAHV